MDRMRNVDGYLSWNYDPLHDVYKTIDGRYAVVLLITEGTYRTYVRSIMPNKETYSYTKHCQFESFEEAAHWCETHRAVGA